MLANSTTAAAYTGDGATAPTLTACPTTDSATQLSGASAAVASALALASVLAMWL